MKIDLQTIGKKGWVVKTKDNLIKPAKGILIRYRDDFFVEWITWEAFEGKFMAESLDGDTVYVTTSTKEFNVYKIQN